LTCGKSADLRGRKRYAIGKPGRYGITIRPSQAERLIAVRTGRRASAEAGVRIGGRRPGTVSAGTAATGSAYGLEVSSTPDMLSVYDASGGAGRGAGTHPRPGLRP